MRDLISRLGIVALLCNRHGLVESAVVVYLRTPIDRVNSLPG